MNTQQLESDFLAGLDCGRHQTIAVFKAAAGFLDDRGLVEFVLAYPAKPAWWTELHDDYLLVEMCDNTRKELNDK